MQLQKKIHESGATTLINVKQTEDIMKLVRSLQESGLFKKSVGETIENDAK